MCEAVVLFRFLDTVEPNEEKTRPYLKAPFLLLRPFPLNLPANESQGANESVTHGVFFFFSSPSSFFKRNNIYIAHS